MGRRGGSGDRQPPVRTVIFPRIDTRVTVSPAARRPVLTLLLLVVVTAAGCQSPTAPATETPRPDATPGAEPTSPSRWDAETHEQTVRDAGNATIVFSKRLTGPAENRYGNGTVIETWNQSRRVLVDFESGRASESFEPLGGTSYTSYRDETGATYQRYNHGGYYLGPERSDSIAVNDSLRPMPADVSRLDNRGRGTVDGVSGTVYVVPSFAVLGDGVYESVDPERVSRFNATYVVDDRGYVAYWRLNFTYDRGDVTLSVLESVRTTDVGSTTVDPPEWLDEAKAETDGE